MISPDDPQPEQMPSKIRQLLSLVDTKLSDCISKQRMDKLKRHQLIFNIPGNDEEVKNSLQMLQKQQRRLSIKDRVLENKIM